MSLLRIENVTKQFYALKALNSISLNVENGNIYGIIGPNGSGKTTLFNCVTGVYAPESGSIIFNGKNITGMSPQKIANIGIRRTFQTIRLFPDMSVAENIYAGFYTSSKQNIFHAITHLGLYKKDEENAWNAVYEVARRFNLLAFIDKPANSLSYGIQRKVEMARALISKPYILVLDEPAAGMNETEKQELTKILSTLKSEGLTILMIEHDMRMVMGICEHIFVLKEGALIAEGKAEEIQNNKLVLEAYIGAEDD